MRVRYFACTAPHPETHEAEGQQAAQLGAALLRIHSIWRQRVVQAPALAGLQDVSRLSIANKQLEIMGRYMAELGLTPVSRTRLAGTTATEPALVMTIVDQHPDGTYRDRNGRIVELGTAPGPLIVESGL